MSLPVELVARLYVLFYDSEYFLDRIEVRRILWERDRDVPKLLANSIDSFRSMNSCVVENQNELRDVILEPLLLFILQLLVEFQKEVHDFSFSVCTLP